MENLPKVAVLMSTFNGEKYIKQQIESILQQVDVNLDLYIRDDGSTDNTLEIIKSFLSLGQIKIVPGNANLGFGLSFMKILYFLIGQGSEYDYFAFADQDDIWLKQKLIKGIEMLKDYSEIPALYVSDQILYRDGEAIGLWHGQREAPFLAQQIYANEFSGCTMIFNKCLLQKMPREEQLPKGVLSYRGHDIWMLCVALITGKVVNDNHAYILYRIHEENVVGNKKRNVVQRFQKYVSLRQSDDSKPNLRKNAAKALLDLYPNISNQDRDVLEKYAYYQNSFKNKWRLLTDQTLVKASKANAVFFRVLVLFNVI